MGTPITKAWESIIRPMIQRPRDRQVAALCLRERDGKTEVLLITSRGTGRWIVPKGWPVDGMDDAQSALIEAWEEAGVEKAEAETVPIGRFTYLKRADGGRNIVPVRLDVDIYIVRVKRMARSFPEKEERKRKWCTPAEAVEMVDEPGLKDALRRL